MSVRSPLKMPVRSSLDGVFDCVEEYMLSCIGSRLVMVVLEDKQCWRRGLAPALASDLSDGGLDHTTIQRIHVAERILVSVAHCSDCIIIQKCFSFL